MAFCKVNLLFVLMTKKHMFYCCQLLKINRGFAKCLLLSKIWKMYYLFLYFYCKGNLSSVPPSPSSVHSIQHWGLCFTLNRATEWMLWCAMCSFSLIFFSLFTLMLLIQSHSLRIMLLVKANLAYSALFRFPCLGNICILSYYILHYIIIAYFSITELTSGWLVLVCDRLC